MRYRGVNAVRLDEVLNFNSLFIVGIIKLQSGGDNFCQCVGNKSAFNKLSCGRNQSVTCRKLTFRTASHASNFVAQIRILKTSFGRRNVFLMNGRSKFIFINQQSGSFSPNCAGGGYNFFVLHCLTHIGIAFLISRISNGGVPRVDCEKFAFNVRAEILNKRHALNRRKFADNAR